MSTLEVHIHLLSVCHFSVIHKTNSSCTNLEGKKRKKKKKTCLILWKTLLYFIFCQVVLLGNTHIGRRKMSIDCYFSILFCFSILFPNWISVLRYLFLVSVEDRKSRHFLVNQLWMLWIFFFLIISWNCNNSCILSWNTTLSISWEYCRKVLLGEPL